ncbi:MULTISPECIES: response regulator transcription factor [Ramlibacter]|nr:MULTISPECIES: LuxR C-terminal-related transcriptional regulator [Ramlibacter]
MRSYYILLSDDDVEAEVEMERVLRVHGYVPQPRAMTEGLLSPVARFQTDLTAWRRDDSQPHHVADPNGSEERARIHARLAVLTDREEQVLSRVVVGRLNKQIASEMGIAERTVKVHRGRVMAKMGAESLAELVRLCERVGR